MLFPLFTASKIVVIYCDLWQNKASHDNLVLGWLSKFLNLMNLNLLILFLILLDWCIWKIKINEMNRASGHICAHIG